MNYVFMGRLLVVGTLTAFSTGFGLGLSLFSSPDVRTAEAAVDPDYDALTFEHAARRDSLPARDVNVPTDTSGFQEGFSFELERPTVGLTDPVELVAHGLADFSETDDATQRSEQRQLREEVVGRGDTLSKLLARHDISARDAHDITVGLSEHYDPRRLRVGQKLALELVPHDEEGRLQLASLEITLDTITKLRLERDAQGSYDVEQLKETLHEETEYRSGQITSSLSLDANRAGVPAGTLAQMIKVFSWDVDFARDIHPGNGFELVFEQSSNSDGTYVESGPLIYAKLTLGSKELEAFRFRFSDGSIEYYSRDGKSLRKSLLRTPVDGARMSSKFGNRRHPVLGYIKKHKGVDFAAPSGTPIFSAGKGRIVEIGRKGSFGNYIRIRHNGTYDTAYAHMKGFKRGLKKGSVVSQGDVIGYVGTTGRSTGPHLHYEVLKNGVQINPMSAKQLNLAVLNGADLKLFRQQLASIDGLRRELSTREVANSIQ